MKRKLIVKKRRCINCSATLKPGQAELCRKCELKIEAQSKADYLKSLEFDPEYRDDISEADQEFRARYEEAQGDLEDIKFKLEQMED